jgi:hypothetical protein
MGAKSKTKLETTPQQKKAWEFYGTDVVPMARGEDTALSQQLEQQATDIAGLQREQSSQQIMDVAGTAGMGSSQVAGLLSESEDNAIQGAFKNVMQAKTSLAGKALDMISALPKGPGQVSESKQGTAGIVKDVAGAAQMITGAEGAFPMGKPVQSPTDPTQGLEQKVTDTEPAVHPSGKEEAPSEESALFGGEGEREQTDGGTLTGEGGAIDQSFDAPLQTQSVDAPAPDVADTNIASEGSDLLSMAGGAGGGAGAGISGAGGMIGDLVGGEEGGALSGAASGASAGMVAGPWGALAGGVVGGVMGFLGDDDDEDEEKEELEEEIQELEETPAGKQKKRREEIKNA